MKVRCINNTGRSLRQFENKAIVDKREFGRFGVSEYGKYEIKVDTEYLVMGIIFFETYQAYLIDDDGFISACPCQLFEIVDNGVNLNWYFRLIEKNEDIYPFVQAIMGYYELCFDKRAYENLIVEKNDESEQIYFRRKIDLEKEYAEK